MKFNKIISYVLGGNPSVANHTLAPQGQRDGNQFVFTFTRSDVALNAGDVSIVLEYGNNLTGWTPVTVPAGDEVVSGVTFDATDGAPNDSIIATIPTGSATEFFVRLKAVK